MYTHPWYVWLVYDRCDCEDPGCYGKSNIAVYEREQPAKQEAEARSKRYGGMQGRPDMHIDKVAVSTKMSGY